VVFLTGSVLAASTWAPSVRFDGDTVVAGNRVGGVDGTSCGGGTICGGGASCGGAANCGGGGAATFGGPGGRGGAGGAGATGFELGAGATNSDFGGGGVFINSDQRRSISLFSTGGGVVGGGAGAATGSVPLPPLNELRQFVQQSPSGLGPPQTAQRFAADRVSAVEDGAVDATSSRPQHSQCWCGVSDSV